MPCSTPLQQATFQPPSLQLKPALSQRRQPTIANVLSTPRFRLDNVEEDAIRNVNIPTGEPFVYDFDADLKPIGEPDEHGFRGRFVGGEEMPRVFASNTSRNRRPGKTSQQYTGRIAVCGG